MKPSVPIELRNVDKNWALSLLCHIQNTQDVQVTHLNIDMPKSDTVLSDICKIDIEATVGSRHLNCKWFVKIIPKRFKDLVIRHSLFEKEIAFYR